MDLHLFNTESSTFMKDLNELSSCAAGEKRNISKSYTSGVMAVIVSDSGAAKIEIDIEKKKRRLPETIEHFFQKFSTFQIKNIPSEADLQWFYTAWTAMEGYFKLDGAGFGASKDFILDLEQHAVWRDGKRVAWLEHFDIGGFLICLCGDKMFSKQDVQLIYHGWED